MSFIRKVRKITSTISPKLSNKIMYRLKMNKKLNLKKPETFNEKINFLKLNCYANNELVIDCTDKYRVRNYVKSKGLEKYLNELYFVYNSADEIDFNQLPKSFVLKCNHGCGYNIVCKNKETFNYNEEIKKLKKWMKEDFGKVAVEPHYSKIDRKIICEKYLDDKKNKVPIDYKFYCFNGNVECVLVCTNRGKKLNIDYYDLNWNYLNYSKEEYRSKQKNIKPQNFNLMIEIASDLSKDFKFVRVDLYDINSKIYFSELTFTPAGGFVNNISDEALNHLGKLIKIQD